MSLEYSNYEKTSVVHKDRNKIKVMCNFCDAISIIHSYAEIFSSTGLQITMKSTSKRHDLASEILQRARDEWNKDRMKRLNFINKTKELSKNIHQ